MFASGREKQILSLNLKPFGSVENMDFCKHKERKARSEDSKIHQALIGEARRRMAANRKQLPRHFHNFHFLRLYWRPLKGENRDFQFTIRGDWSERDVDFPGR